MCVHGCVAFMRVCMCGEVFVILEFMVVSHTPMRPIKLTDPEQSSDLPPHSNLTLCYTMIIYCGP